MKNCAKCGLNKPVEEYYLRSTGKLENRCKKCFKSAQKANIESKRERNLAEGERLRGTTQTKVCSRCSLTKLYVEFNRQAKSSDGHSVNCRDCSRPYSRKYYAEHRERILELGTSNWNRVRQIKQEFYIEFLRSHPCVDCGNMNILVLQADHQGNKKANISAMVGGTCGLDTMIEELSKCEIRCANCHQEKTARQLGFWRVQYV